MSMKYLELFEEFGNSNKNKYIKINNFVDGEKLEYHQVPFSLGYGEGICIDDAERWSVCISNNFVYDYIKDDDIQKVLKNDLKNIDISRDWASVDSDVSNIGFETAYTNKNKHILRVAKLVQEIQQNKPISPILMYFDAMSSNYDIKNHIEDGNHRIRALQYLKFNYYPAYIYGSHADKLKEVINTSH